MLSILDFKDSRYSLVFPLTPLVLSKLETRHINVSHPAQLSGNLAVYPRRQLAKSCEHPSTSLIIAIPCAVKAPSIRTRLDRLTGSVAHYLDRNRHLFSCLIILCSLQASILVYRDVGMQTASIPVSKIIPRLWILDTYLRVGLLKVIQQTGMYWIRLFMIQSIPVLLYGCCQGRRTRKFIALMIWILPGVIGFPKFGGVVAYLTSLFSAIGYFPFVSPVSTEDIFEGMAFLVAVLGWFNLFWLGITLKKWFYR